MKQQWTSMKSCCRWVVGDWICGQRLNYHLSGNFFLKSWYLQQCSSSKEDWQIYCHRTAIELQCCLIWSYSVCDDFVSIKMTVQQGLMFGAFFPFNPLRFADIFQSWRVTLYISVACHDVLMHTKWVPPFSFLLQCSPPVKLLRILAFPLQTMSSVIVISVCCES